MDTIRGKGNLGLGILLILLGIMFFVGQFFDINLGRLGWPFFIIVPGVALFLLALVMGGEAGEGLVIAGSIVTTAGLLLFYQNITGHWESWAYAWALVAPTSVGVGRVIYGVVRGPRKLVTDGLQIAGVGLAIFLVAGTFFELVIGISGRRFPFGDLLWPLLLIGLGLLLLLRNVFTGARAKK